MLSPEDHALFKAYYKSETKYYIQRLEKYLNGDKYSFNIKVMLLQTFYLCYRKMYAWSIIFALIGFIVGLLQGLFFSGLYQKPGESYQMLLLQAINIAFVLTVAAYANKLYIETSIRDIVKIKEQTDNTEERLTLARKKGGVSWISPIIVFILVVLIWVQWY